MKTELDGPRTVAVFDPQPVTVEGLRALLAQSRRYRLLEPSRTLGDLKQLILMAMPQIALVDKSPGVNEVADWLCELRQPCLTQSPVVIWGGAVTDADALRLMQAGARGVLRKSAPLDSILACIDAVCAGGSWMDANLFQATGAGAGIGRSGLTARERQVLELVEQGLRNKDIARELGIQPGTVKIHLKHIFEKSGVRGRYGLALSSFRPLSPAASALPAELASSNALRA